MILDIKGCPFCLKLNAQLSTIETVDNRERPIILHEIVCLNCGATSAQGISEKHMIRKWNRAYWAIRMLQEIKERGEAQKRSGDEYITLSHGGDYARICEILR